MADTVCFTIVTGFSNDVRVLTHFLFLSDVSTVGNLRRVPGPAPNIATSSIIDLYVQYNDIVCPEYPAFHASTVYTVDPVPCRPVPSF